MWPVQNTHGQWSHCVISMGARQRCSPTHLLVWWKPGWSTASLLLYKTCCDSTCEKTKACLYFCLINGDEVLEMIPECNPRRNRWSPTSWRNNIMVNCIYKCGQPTTVEVKQNSQAVQEPHGVIPAENKSHHSSCIVPGAWRVAYIPFKQAEAVPSS